MAIYMIGYDLHPSKGENYDKLFTALEAIGSGSKTNFDVATRGCPLFIHYSSVAIIPTNA